MDPSEIILAHPESGTSYRLGKLLGEGGFGKCYEMTECSTNKTYAMKLLSLVGDSRSLLWHKIMHEIDIMRNLCHKHVVKFSHYLEDEDFMCIFMELCSRESLEHILRARETLTYPEVRYYLRQLALALKYIHSKGILHRDIKLENLFINEEMELKVGDFGLAAWMEPVGQKKKTFCGTLDYIAPEVWNGEGHGPESDVWALGCVVYTLLVGKLPFWGQDMEETYWRVTEVQYSLPKSLSVAAQKLISGIFRKNPRDRLTLDQILQHEFLTEGFTPAKLPPSSCVTVPQLKPSYPVKRWFIRKAQCRYQRRTPKVARPSRKGARDHCRVKNMSNVQKIAQPDVSKDTPSASVQQNAKRLLNTKPLNIPAKKGSRKSPTWAFNQVTNRPLVTWALDGARKSSSPCVCWVNNRASCAGAEATSKLGVGDPTNTG